MGFTVTREGVRFCFLLAVVAFAAYNTRNNLLYLMLSVAIAGAVVALVSGFASLKQLSITDAERPDVYAGLAFQEKLRLNNGSRILDAFGLNLDGGLGNVPVLTRGASGTVRRERLYRRRGLFDGETVEVATRFPFGFFRWTRRLAVPHSTIVFPRVRPIDDSLLSGSTDRGPGGARRRGAGDEFFRLRDYTSGDHVHHIHWRTTAKLGRLMVRELADEDDGRFCVVFEPVLGRGREASDFEIMVSAVASLVGHLARTGVTFRFLVGNVEFPPRGSGEYLRGVLGYLATVQPAASGHPGLRSQVDAAIRAGETVIRVAFEEDGDGPIGFRSEVVTLDPRHLLRL